MSADPATAAAHTATGQRARRVLRHVPALDGLRGVAVALVVAGHVQTFLVPGSVVFDAAGPIPGGFLGVDVFFVLSGFLITSLLLGEQAGTGRIGFVPFYRRRAVRLLPALYVLLAVHLAYAWAVGLPLRPEWLSIRAAVLYVSNWAWHWDGLVAAPGLGHLWSLAVEEQFYLFWPLAVALLFGVRRSGAAVAMVLGGAILAVAVHRAILFDGGISPYFLYQRTDTRLDALLVGALLGSLWVRGLTVRRGLPIAAWCATAVLGWSVARYASSDAPLYRGWFTVVAVAAGVVVLAAADGRWSGARLLGLAPLRLLGRVSYGLYLWHLPVFDMVVRHGSSWPVWFRVAAGLVLSAAATAASWTLVEQPASRWSRRRHTLPARPSDAPGATVPGC